MEVDVTCWAVIRDEPGGRDSGKRWLAKHADASREDHWLWKSRQKTGDGSFDALTDCAEVASSRIAALLGVPAAECRLAVRDGVLGLISKNVAPAGFSLYTGVSYLPEVDGYHRSVDGAERGRMRRDVGYDLDAMEHVLRCVSPPPGTEGLSALQFFAGYLVLDAVIANTDRHPGNWALLECEQDGRRYLAPTFDHGTALGAGLTEVDRALKDPKAFARKGKANPFGPPRPSLVNLALAAVDRWEADIWLERLRSLNREDLRGTLLLEDRLSVTAGRFMERVLLENRRRLCDVDASED